jgi:hypothetical protein
MDMPSPGQMLPLHLQKKDDLKLRMSKQQYKNYVHNQVKAAEESKVNPNLQKLRKAMDEAGIIELTQEGDSSEIGDIVTTGDNSS